MKNIVKSQLRVEEREHLLLKKLAYLKGVSMNELVNEGIKLYLEKEKNLLRNADIVVL